MDELQPGGSSTRRESLFDGGCSLDTRSHYTPISDDSTNFQLCHHHPPISARPLWENFLISERIKHLNYQLNYPNFYFWRSKDQQEVDWIEESDLKLKAFEFKWKDTGKFKFPKKFIEAYHPISQIIDMDNFNEFLLDDINASED